MSGLGLAGLTHAQAWFAALSQTATVSLVTAIWQGILLAMMAGLGLRLIPKTPAAVRFAIWFGVFALVAALPVLSFLHKNAGSVDSSGHAWFVLNDRWCLILAAVWLTASLVRAVSLAMAAFRVRALWKRATPVELEGVAPTGSRRVAQVCTSDEVDRPTVIGFFAPKILIPAWLLEKLTPAELEQIVLHEDGHLGRADDWMNLLQKIALVVFPLNPALAWVERRLCFERELAVDERVLRAFAGKAGAAKAYAACLATLAEYRLGRRALTLAIGALGRESELGRRVGRILRREAGMRPLHSKLVFGGAMLGLLAAATGFEHCPPVVSFAQGASPSVAQHVRWQPTQVAVNRVQKVSAFSVVYRPNRNRQVVPISHEPHQTLAVASLPASRQRVAGQTSELVQLPIKRTVESSARMVQTLARIPNAQNRSRTISDAEPSQSATGVTQWLVVTAWQNGQSTRMVFTDAGQDDVAGSDAMPTNSGPNYEAVPVRGGWLIFQL